MKRVYFLVTIVLAGWLVYAMAFSDPWLTDFEMAKKEARESGRPILLYFSGSDWCGVCMKVKKEILETDVFKDYAGKHLVLMLADFPRMKKNKPDARTIKQNEALAEKYNPSGGFPYTVLLNADGKVLQEWKGNPGMSPEAFVDQIKKCRRSL